MPPRLSTRFFSLRPRRAWAQRGLSLVELAIGLAIVGLLAAMALKSQEVVESYRQAQFVTKVQTLVSQLGSYRRTWGRWPGDCNRDGLVDLSLTNLGALTQLEYAVATSLTAAASSSATYALGNTCPSSTLSPFANGNVPYNELRLAGLIPSGETNRKSSDHGLGGEMHLGTLDVSATTNYLEDKFNALVLTDVPIVAARRLAVAINGQDGSASNKHRVRRINALGTFDPLWTASGETELKRITVVVFFDRIPP